MLAASFRRFHAMAIGGVGGTARALPLFEDAAVIRDEFGVRREGAEGVARLLGGERSERQNETNDDGQDEAHGSLPGC